MSKAFGVERLSAEAAMVEKALALRKAGKGGGEAAILAGFTDYAGYQRALGRYRQQHPDEQPETPPAPVRDALAGYRVLICAGQSAMPAKYRLTLTQTTMFLNSGLKAGIGNAACVRVFYSEADARIALMPCGETDEGALRVCRRKNGSCRVNCRSCVTTLCDLAGKPPLQKNERIQLCGEPMDGRNVYLFPLRREESL